MTGASPIDRAFDLARSGLCRSVAEIIRRLPPEDRETVEAHLIKPNNRRELILVCSNAWLAARQPYAVTSEFR
jgi:hypothetical protein